MAQLISPTRSYTLSPLSDEGMTPPPLPVTPSKRLISQMRAVATPSRLSTIQYAYPMAKWMLSDEDLDAKEKKLEHEDLKSPDKPQTTSASPTRPPPPPSPRRPLRPSANNTLNQPKSQRQNTPQSHQTFLPNETENTCTVVPEKPLRNHNTAEGSDTIVVALERPTSTAKRGTAGNLPPFKKAKTQTPRLEFKVGMYIRVLLTSSNNTSICRISHIHRTPPPTTPTSAEPLPELTVQWLYLRRDISTTAIPELRYLLRNLKAREAVLTNHTDTIPRESVVKVMDRCIFEKGAADRKLGWEQFLVQRFWRFDNAALTGGRCVGSVEELSEQGD